jgi:pSer/pThr/pTyr-binding forkhead associated (FHA) protein
MDVKLVGIDQETADFEASLDMSPLRIGRHPMATLRIDDETVSDFHCELGRINGVLWVRDLGSTHGTFVNGFHVVQSHLMPGDRLTVGMVTFRVSYDRKPKRLSGAVDLAMVSAE